MIQVTSWLSSPGQKAPRPQIEVLSARRQSTSVDQVTYWVIHEGGFLFIIYHNCQKSSPIRWIMSWDTHGAGYRIFSSHGDFASRLGWISRQYVHHYFAKIKVDFAT
jgi:hypothetical protein